MKIEYELVEKPDFSESHQNVLADMLRKQGKVQGDLISKVDRCKSICIARVDGDVVAIGAIKQKTRSDFCEDKAGLPDLASEFEWELGYLYTVDDYTGRGIASSIVRLLIDNYGNGNLMASTELTENPAMVKILENIGFRLFGKPWKSNIHDAYLGLFLKVR